MALALLLLEVLEGFQLLEPFRFSVLGLTRNWLETRLRKGKVKPNLYFSCMPRYGVKSYSIKDYWYSQNLRDRFYYRSINQLDFTSSTSSFASGRYKRENYFFCLNVYLYHKR